MNKRIEIIFSGVGGQGLLLSGNLFCSAAAIVEKKCAVMSTMYGTETRGTFTKADLILSDEPIDFPEALAPDIVIALAQVAYDKYVNDMKNGSIVIYNSSQIQSAESKARQIALPMDAMATELGSLRVANLVALGALTAVPGIIEPKSVEQMILERFCDNRETTHINMEAFRAGYQQTLRTMEE